MREAMREHLRSLGYAATGYASAEEFLASTKLNETACLITDVKMPGLSGLDLQNRLLKQGWSIPIIFVTAYAEERLRKQAIDAGAAFVLDKPYQEELLIQCLDAVLRP